MGSASKRSGWLAAAAGLALSAGVGHAAVTTINLFTTQNDFNLWASSTTATAAGSTAYDYDGAVVNGVGNPTVGAGTAGSLQLTEVSTTASIGYSYLATNGTNLATNSRFLQAIDPGAVTAYTAATSYGPGSTAAYSGVINLAFTIPTSSAGNYFQVGINLNYDGNNYNPLFPPVSATSAGTVNGLTTYTESIPYTINAHSLTNFNFDLRSNSNYVLTSPFYVDAITVNAPVPEPTTLGLATGGAVLTLARRRRSA